MISFLSSIAFVIIAVALALYFAPIFFTLLSPVTNVRDKYQSKWAAITGASAGVGRSLALELASQGLSLLLIGENDSEMKKFHRLLSENPKYRERNQEFTIVEVDLSSSGRHHGPDYLDTINAALKPNCKALFLTSSLPEPTTQGGMVISLIEPALHQFIADTLLPFANVRSMEAALTRILKLKNPPSSPASVAAVLHGLSLRQMLDVVCDWAAEGDKTAPLSKFSVLNSPERGIALEFRQQCDLVLKHASVSLKDFSLLSCKFLESLPPSPSQQHSLTKFLSPSASSSAVESTTPAALPLHEMTDSLLKSTIELNAMSQIRIASSFYQKLVASSNVPMESYYPLPPQKINMESPRSTLKKIVSGGGAKRGAIVFVSSSSSFYPSPLFSAYSASKAMVQQFAASLAVEAQAHSIDILCAVPGFMRHHYIALSGGDTVRDVVETLGAEPEDVAQTILKSVGRVSVRDVGYFSGIARHAQKLIDPNMFIYLMKSRHSIADFIITASTAVVDATKGMFTLPMRLMHGEGTKKKVSEQNNAAARSEKVE